ncbi:bifunctional adenosylcobinamide kinase/adenosylcobinamide-phosphate guanylyltransferase [Actinomadura craniellae]|uniref:bifunctional adenosylcobinamide kinase/adenosylcobinamide-phosphate guanylyltransferase n=1 Tax=Actinomadura craniellae TaxID=2231787 RepID=UPI001F1BA908|nr:bifunctional adenosylcobinamide kinase/adenosylcobinamide-phosphate guanylyltransferase [Actinomadura craniellae]
MKIEVHGDGPPEPDCRCAACARARAAGGRPEPLRVLLDGVPAQECPRRPVPGGHEVRAPGGGLVLAAGGPGDRPEPAAGPPHGPHQPYDAVLLDLAGVPEHLGLLRRTGAVGPATAVHAVHTGHRLPPAELARRLGWWRRPAAGPYRTLLLGGVRSGKSAEGELRLMAHPDVTYAATGGARPGDAEWAARVAAHRGRRPAWWRTVETTDLPGLLETARGAVLIDGIGGWLTAVLDEAGGWDDPSAAASRIDELVDAWRGARARVVAVSEEVGLAPVALTRAGRIFTDLLGRLNQRLAAESEEAALVVAGRVLDL